MAVEATLRAQVLEALVSYLEGGRSGPDVSSWATDVFVSRTANDFESELVEATLMDLMIVGHDDPQWDTPRADLEYLRDCLLGKREFVPPVMIEKHG